jgi:hypothetical protein
MAFLEKAQQGGLEELTAHILQQKYDKSRAWQPDSVTEWCEVVAVAEW